MPPLLSLKTSSRRSSASPRESKEFSFNDVSDPDADDMETEKYTSTSRPLSVSIPKGFSSQGPYCPRRPNLSDILANVSPPPWTLSAFMAYLSQNHCLETLEFTMDAARYRKHYNKMAARSEGGEIAPGSDESTYMQGLWHRLMAAYIAPNGAREVNLPSSVRDELLSQNDPLLPPTPDALNMAVDKVHELMEESVLVPFLNSFYPQTAQPSSNGSSTEDLNFSAHSFDDRGLYRSRTGYRKNNVLRRGSPVSATATLSSSTPTSSISPQYSLPSQPITQHRASAPSSISQFARSLSHSARHGFPLSSSPQSPPRPLSTVSTRPVQPSMPTSEPFAGNGTLSPTITSLDTPMTNGLEDFSPSPLPTLADDNASSPSATTAEPMTPPTTPPTCDSTVHTLPTHSPPSAGGWGNGRGNPWKRMRYSFGWRRRHDVDPPHSPNGEHH